MKKVNSFFFLLLLAVSLSACGYDSGAVNDSSKKTEMNRSNELESAKAFKYYLDAGSESILTKMKQQDLVIVEPVVMERKYIKEAQESGTLVYGYINSMEADKWNKELISRFKEEAFFHGENGDRHFIPQWDAYLMDISNQHYQDVLLDEIERRIVDTGLDGVFLDTVGSIEDYHQTDDQILIEQQKGMKLFMERIKERFPDLSIAQNWGFQTLRDYTAPYVEFVMWEQFDYSKITEDSWSQDIIKLLKEAREQYGIEVMTVSFKEEKESRALAETHGFKNLYNPDGSYYNEWE
jgi:endo-alpha-1,4-polygalactosaminidase (GH114 family)